MVALLVIAALAALSIVATIIVVARDGYRPVRTDPARIPTPERLAHPAGRAASRAAERSSAVSARTTEPARAARTAEPSEPAPERGSVRTSRSALPAASAATAEVSC